MFLSFPRVFAFAGEFIFKRKQIRKVQSTKLEQITADRMKIREKNDVPGLCKLSVRSFYVYHTRKLSFFHVKSSLLNDKMCFRSIIVMFTTLGICRFTPCFFLLCTTSVGHRLTCNTRNAIIQQIKRAASASKSIATLWGHGQA